MEPFIDFGLFEVLAAAGVTVVARSVYRRKAIARLVIVASMAAPGILIVVGHTELTRWIAAVSLAASVLNAAILWPLTRPGQPAQTGGGLGEQLHTRSPGIEPAGPGDPTHRVIGGWTRGSAACTKG
jgi:hypothetical protein